MGYAMALEKRLARTNMPRSNPNDVVLRMRKEGELEVEEDERVVAEVRWRGAAGGRGWGGGGGAGGDGVAVCHPRAPLRACAGARSP